MTIPRYTLGPCPFCGSTDQVFVSAHDRLGSGEKDMGVGVYYRELWQCACCAHLRNVHDHDLAHFYTGEYNAAAFSQGLKRQFDRIMGLPHEQSDNRRRVARITDYMGPAGGRSVLDIGSGSAVFPAAMREQGWMVTAMDPDPAAIDHARTHAGVDAMVGDVTTFVFERRFDLVTFNKVLEHIADPVAALGKAKQALKPGGTIYVELPDGEGALADSPGRQEFFLEHWHAFSIASIALLGRRAGLRAEIAARTRCPSGKYTLHAFMINAMDKPA